MSDPLLRSIKQDDVADVGAAVGDNDPSLQPLMSPAQLPSPETVLEQALDVLDKQYRLYSWNDSKALSLITADSVLFAVVGFLIAACLPDTMALGFLGGALLLLSASLLVVLRQVVPQGSSGRSGEEPNVRSLRGISSFQSWQSYRDKFRSYTVEQYAEDALRQTFGMACNNDQSRRQIRIGARLTLAGIVFLIAAAGAAALSARDIHLLGAWSSAEVSSIEQPTLPAEREGS